MYSARFHNLPCPNPLQGKRYTGLLYGLDGRCRGCNQFHGTLAALLPETDRTEYMASRLAAAANAKETMIGLLIAADGRMVASTSSGDGSPNRGFLANAARTLYRDIVIGSDVPLDGVPTVGGRAVPSETRLACHAPFSPIPGQCAAIKVVGHALSNGWPRPYVMTETWSARNQATQDATRLRTGKDLAKFKTAEPIESCYSCGALVPLMLCGG